jgi:hypothetical protein
MDTTSIVTIVVGIGVIILFVKFVVSPVVRVILGIVIFCIAVYLLQRFLNFNLNQILAPFGISLDLSKWGPNFNWILGPANHYVDQAKNFLIMIWGNLTKSFAQQ